MGIKNDLQKDLFILCEKKHIEKYVGKNVDLFTKK